MFANARTMGKTFGACVAALAAGAAHCQIVSDLDKIDVPREREPPDAQPDRKDAAPRNAAPEDAAPRDAENDAPGRGRDAAIEQPPNLRADAMPDVAPEASCATWSPAEMPSCRDDPRCGAGRATSCCNSILVPASTFPMGSAPDGAPAGARVPESPAHRATVAAFRLDTFEVTVARFQRFVEDYDCWRTRHPLPEEGALFRTDASEQTWGWQPAWSSKLPATSAELASRLECSPAATWGGLVDSSSRDAPINCVTWYEAFAFCIWDGGRLPTETQWEYAASGQDHQTYPCGFLFDFQCAVYGGAPISDVGSLLHAGPLGHYDLAGNVAEWVFDSVSNYTPDPCLECVVGRDGNDRVVRGGSWANDPIALRGASRDARPPEARGDTVGFRCARDPAP